LNRCRAFFKELSLQAADDHSLSTIMSTILIRPEAAVLDSGIDTDPILLIRNGILEEIAHRPTPGERVEDIAGTLLPGLVDLQVNGSGGHGVDEANPDALDRIAAQVFAGGATAFLPTLVTTEFQAMLGQISAVASWIESEPQAGAIPLGIHVEGPFLELAGAHDEAHLLDPSPEYIEALLEAGRGRIRLLTLAPGLTGAPGAVASLCEAGVTVSLGHGNSVEQFAACVDAGARMATHLHNAMGGSHHRRPGLAGFALDEPRLCCSLIADGHHLDPIALRNAFRILGAERCILVTDAVAAAGMADGEYRLAGSKVWLREGAVRDARGELAGSALGMAAATENLLHCLHERDPETLARVASSNAAHIIGARDFGSIRPGCKADFALLSPEGRLRCLRY